MASVDQIVRLFTACMSDPARPTYCARVLCGCLHALDGRRDSHVFTLDAPFFPPRFKGYESIRRTHHAYLNSYVAFLSMSRSVEELRELVVFISVCACPMPSDNGTARMLAWLHRFKPARLFTFRDFVEALVRHIGGILNNAVETKTINGPVSSAGLRKNARKHLGGRLWPVDMNQLIPYGLEQSMKGDVASFRLCREATRFQDTLLVVTEFLSIFGGRVLRHILQFDPDWALSITILTGRVLRERKETLGLGPVRMDMQLDWVHTLTLILMLCSEVNQEGQRDPRDVAHFVSRTASFEKDGSTKNVNCDLLYVCNEILKVLPSFRDGTTLFTNEVIDRFTLQSSCFAAMLYCYRPDDDAMEYHPEVLNLRAATDAAIADPLQYAFEGFRWLRHCCAPECMETFATKGRKFSHCAGCGVLRYCSKDCQKSAWRHAMAPHKDVCSKLRTLREQTNIPRDRVPNDRQPFIDACNEDESLRALANDCATHMYYLSTVRQDFGVVHVPEAYRALFTGVGAE